MVRVSAKAGTAIPAPWMPGLLILLLVAHPHPAGALDVSLLAGATGSPDTDESTYAWQIDFRHNFEGPFAASASWINEGHFRDDHRDGLAGQLWGRIPLRDDTVSIGFGAGAYRYFDTKRRSDGSHSNAHGTAPIYSLSASYFTDTRWFFRLTANHIHPAREIDTNSILLGVGYRLGREPVAKTRARGPGRESPPSTTGAELTPFLGLTVHNSLESQGGFAGGIEYRRGVSRNLDWTLSWINDDNQGEIRRTGIGTQIWLVDSYVRRRVVLGLGAGLYTFFDRNPNEGHSRVDVAGLVTLSAGYRFGDRWIARFSWNRTMTDDDRDTDIFVLGVGYRWDE